MSIIAAFEFDGTLVVDSRLIAERLEIYHHNLMETLEKYQDRIESRFGIIRFETGKIEGRGRPSKYVLLTEPQAIALMSFSRNTEAVIECKLDLVEAFEKAKNMLTQQFQLRPYWYDRLTLFNQRTHIPRGWFCIFKEIADFVSQLESQGYQLPDDARLDASVGSRFCSHLRTLGIEPDEVCQKYPHWYPGYDFPVRANLYPLNLLEIFREWYEEVYLVNYVKSYFRGRKDPQGLAAVDRCLRLLSGS